LESSIGEFESIEQLLQQYRKFLDETQAVLDKWDCKIVTSGYNPYAKASELNLIPKQRYYIMDDYFKKIGGTGINMMRGSCATQISIDYISEKDYKDKFRVANALSPILAYMYDNTDIYEGQRADTLTRYKIWSKLEGDTMGRTGFAADCFLDKTSFESYARFVMQSKPLFVYNNNDEIILTQDKTVEEIYKNKIMQQKDIEHVLSMVFPFVRLKRYIEIRMADSLPFEKVKEYLQIVKGVFYTPQNLKKILYLLKGMTIESANSAWRDLMQQKDNAKVYGKNIVEWIDILKSMKSKD